MKKSIFRWSAAVLVAASLGLALGGCGAKDKKTDSSSAKASTSKVEKKAKSNSKKSAASSAQEKMFFLTFLLLLFLLPLYFQFFCQLQQQMVLAI